MPDLIYEKRDGIAYLTMNRPEKRNAISRLLLEQIKEAMRRVAVNPQSLSNRNRPQHSLTALSRITHRGNSNP